MSPLCPQNVPTLSPLPYRLQTCMNPRFLVFVPTVPTVLQTSSRQKIVKPARMCKAAPVAGFRWLKAQGCTRSRPRASHGHQQPHQVNTTAPAHPHTCTRRRGRKQRPPRTKSRPAIAGTWHRAALDHGPGQAMATSSRARSTPQRPPCRGGACPSKPRTARQTPSFGHQSGAKKPPRWAVFAGVGTGPGWVRSCGPVRGQVDHFGPLCPLVQVISPPLQQVGPVFHVGGSVVSRPHLIAFFVG